MFGQVYRSLSANKARSFLTVLGIVIGIGSVIAMVSVGQGAKNSIQASIQSSGSNLIMITPGAQRGVGTQVSAGQGSAQTLVMADADALSKNIDNVQAIAPELSRRYQIRVKGNNTNAQVIGTVPAYPSVRKIEMAVGSFITGEHLKTYDKVAVLGPTLRDDLFGVDASVVGQFVRVNNIEFKVIGITVPKGGSGFSNADNNMYIPLATAQRYLAGDTYLSTISVEVTNETVMTAVQQQITDLLLQRHKISNPQQADFTVLNQADIVAAASSVTNTFTTLLASIAGISLLVGGIGIMNMMLTTVTERTREIGLRKAIGAQRKEISNQFLLEAITLTFTGGMLGVILGTLLSMGVTHFTGLQTQITFYAVALASGVSILIGIIFGYYPALRAARLNPIEALRFE